MSKVIAAHQPNFIPNLGFFDKMNNCDVFVIRDEVQISFNSDSFQHRNKIRSENAEGWKWLTIPIEDDKTYIKNVRIKKYVKRGEKLWHEDIINALKINYSKMPYLNDYINDIERIFDNSDDNMIDLNMKVINYIKDKFEIKAEIVMASSLNLRPAIYDENYKSDPSEDIARICEVLGGDIYLSGNGGRNYLDIEPFEKRGIKVIYQNFEHPRYTQKYPGFIPNMCVLDALFCVGKEILNDNIVKIDRKFIGVAA